MMSPPAVLKDEITPAVLKDEITRQQHTDWKAWADGERRRDVELAADYLPLSLADATRRALSRRADEIAVLAERTGLGTDRQLSRRHGDIDRHRDRPQIR